MWLEATNHLRQHRVSHVRKQRDVKCAYASPDHEDLTSVVHQRFSPSLALRLQKSMELAVLTFERVRTQVGKTSVPMRVRLPGGITQWGGPGPTIIYIMGEWWQNMMIPS